MWNLKHECRIDRDIKTPKNFRNRSRWKFLIFWGRISTPLRRLRWNFAGASAPRCPWALQSLTWIVATSRPCGGEKRDFWPVSKYNTGSLPLCGILLLTKKHHIFAPAAGAHCAIFPILFVVIVLVVPIIKRSHSFSSMTRWPWVTYGF